MRRLPGILAYIVPTFVLGFVWHLVLFEQYYLDLQIYRADILVPLGFLSMLVQACIFAWIYERTFAATGGSFATKVWRYGALGALLSWSFTTLAVAAKNVMASVPDYMLIETAFTIVQWLMVAPLTVLALQRLSPGRAARA